MSRSSGSGADIVSRSVIAVAISSGGSPEVTPPPATTAASSFAQVAAYCDGLRVTLPVDEETTETL